MTCKNLIKIPVIILLIKKVKLPFGVFQVSKTRLKFHSLTYLQTLNLIPTN